MKKLLILAGILCFTLNYAAFADEAKTAQKVSEIQTTTKIINRAEREAAFEKKLGLSEAQKQQAKEIRKRGHEKLKPVMQEIKQKRQEAEMIKKSRMAVQMQEEQLSAIDADLKVLQKKAAEIRKANMKEFESILTRAQKRTLKQMKKEGRKNFETNGCPYKKPVEVQK